MIPPAVTFDHPTIEIGEFTVQLASGDTSDNVLTFEVFGTGAHPGGIDDGFIMRFNVGANVVAISIVDQGDWLQAFVDLAGPHSVNPDGLMSDGTPVVNPLVFQVTLSSTPTMIDFFPLLSGTSLAQAQFVPEPSTLLLLSGGIAWLSCVRRRTARLGRRSVRI
jgi:hypothetical protein